jgi:Uma2 family endonuclease
MVAARSDVRVPVVAHDHIVVLRGASWADYQRVMELRGDKSAPRIAFLEGDLEIMSPSSSHENIKSLIGRLVEVYCLEHDLEFRALGAWTLEDKTVARGVEPDECYVLSTDPDAQRPDLAIEVVWTSGGIAKLDIYRKLGVREVWFWRDGVLSVHLLHGESYVTTTTSAALPGLDLALLASFLDRPTTSAAIKAYRAALTAPKP